MDTTQNNQSTNPQQATQQQVHNQQNPVHGAPQVSQPISGPHKELGPTIEAPVAEYVAPSSPHEMEPILVPELKEAGVESAPNTEMPQITEEHKKIGVTTPQEMAPVVVDPSSSAITLPTYTQVQQSIKETPVEESAHWLAVLHKFILERLGAKA